MPAVSLEKRGNIALVLVDNPPVNALSHEVRIGLMAKLKEAAADEDMVAIVLGAKGRTFVAGADIKEFGKPRPDPSLHAIMDLIEASEKPVVAALFGTPLGGGLELAMACHYRIAHSGTMMGQPEVHLGIIPGAGGTQRLPRLVGVPTALDMIVTGKPIDARAALEKGLVDRLAEDDLMDDAVDYAAELQAGAQPLKLASRIKIIADDIPADFFDAYRARIAPKTRGLLAPGLAVSAVEAAVALDFEEGIAIEAELFAECMASPQSAALMHVFFAQREAGRVPHLKKDLDPREIKTIGVIGGGTMGGGISMAFANVGIPVTMIEVSDEAIEASMKRIRGNYAGAVKRGKMSEEGVEERVGLISPSTDYGDLSEADLIIEAVFEKMELKKEIFAKLDEVAKPG
ncbi:MAG: enoyl-CoA hydratase-related protein, partial [Sphingomonadales bacterium]